MKQFVDGINGSNAAWYRGKSFHCTSVGQRYVQNNFGSSRKVTS